MKNRKASMHEKVLAMFKGLRKQLINSVFNKTDEPDLTRQFNTDERGWLRINGRTVELVSRIKLVPGLRYQVKNHFYTYTPYQTVHVTDQVGSLIDLYLSLDDDYANMPLNDFIRKALPEAFSGKDSGNTGSEGDS